MRLSAKLTGFEKTIPSKPPDKNQKTIAVTHEHKAFIVPRIIREAESHVKTEAAATGPART